ncbi:MAG: filamentous hemagglutinin N-terminal domain-containing protein, partial [Waterburya sp.]
GETLALIGKGVKLTGGNLFADGGRIEVGSINSPSLVNLIAKEGSWTLDYADISSLQDIELSERASVDVSSTLGSGSIQLQGRNVTLDGGSAIFSFTGSQPGGTIEVNATDTLNVTGVAVNNQVTSALYTAASLDGTAKGGDLAIATDKLITSEGAQIGADTYGKGSAGIITVEAKESVLLSGTFPDNDIVPTALGTFVQPGATGSSSQLNLTTQRLTIADGAQLITATIGDGSAATLTANVSFLTELRGTGSAISSSVLLIPDLPAPTGNGGKINLTTGQLKISDEAKVTVSNDGLGDAGDIQIISPHIELSDRAQIVAETAAGAGGNINLQINDALKMGDNSLISAQAFNRANGGNVNIDSNFIVARPNQIAGNGSDIIASAAAGDGGRITINAESLLGIKARKAVDNNRTNDIDASSEFGLDGTVSIFSSDLNPVQGATELPSNVVEAEQLTAQACNPNREATLTSDLAIAGKGGITPTPIAPLTSENIMVSEQNSTSTIHRPIETSKGKIQPAMGIKVTKSGKIVLTAYRTNNAGERIPDIKPNCN